MAKENNIVIITGYTAIEAELAVPEGGAEGVLCAFADFIGGFSLWVDEKGDLIHTYQFLGVDTYKQGPRQRRRGRPGLRGQGAVCLHRQAEEGRL